MCKCKSARVTRILIFGITVNNKLTSAYISNIRQHINNMFQDNSFVLINNKNIPTSSVFCNGIHLLDAPTSTLISQKPSEITNSCIANIESEAKCCSESFKKLKQKNHGSVIHKFDKGKVSIKALIILLALIYF